MTQSQASGTWIVLLDTIQKEQSIRDEFVLMRGPGRGDENPDVPHALRELSVEAHGGPHRYRPWAPHIRRFSMLTGSQCQTRSSQAEALH
jgi:hypothetical protein